MKNAGVNGYINSLYRNVLLREAREEETNFWAGQVAQGMSSASLAEIFVVSEEAQKVTMVLRLYDVFFDRTADIGGLQYWLGRFKTEDSLADMARAFVASSEFQEAYGSRSDADYVEALYGNLFERETDAAGKAYWVERLSNGEVDRSDVALALAFSDEALSRDGAATRFAESYLALRSSSIDEPQTEVVEALARTSLAEAIAQLQTVAGTAQNGILRNAQVSRDSDGDGVPDTVSTTVNTGENGQFTVHGGYGSILVQGGYDLTTGRYNDKILSAPGSKLIDDEAALHQKIVVTPLTTLVAAMVNKGMSLGDAVQKLKIAFALDDATDPLVFDHTGVATSKTATLEEQQEAVTVKGLAAQLSVIMENVAGAISGAAGQQLGMDIPKLTTWVSSVLADAVLKAGTGADGAAGNLAASLASKDFLSDVIKNAADELAKAHPSAISADAMAKLSDLAGEAAMAIGNLNSVIQQSVDAYVGGEKPGVTAIDAISAIAKAESLGQGPMQDALTSGVASGNLSGALSNYSGANLTTAIKQIEIGLIAEGVGSTSGGSVLDGVNGGGAGGGAANPGGGNGGGGVGPELPGDGDGSGGDGNEGSTKQAPWTLLMSVDGMYWGEARLLSSDGSVDGTSILFEGEWNRPYPDSGTGFALSADKTRAFFFTPDGTSSSTPGMSYYGRSVYATDGTVAGTFKLPSVMASSDAIPLVLGSHFLFSGLKGLLTDGTVDGSSTLSGWLSAEGIVASDSERQVVWYTNYSVPFGRELYQSGVSEGEIYQIPLGDIAPGSASGMQENYWDGDAAILPNGNLLFSASDGKGSSRLWVSDGTAEGTRAVTGESLSYVDYPASLTSFNDGVVLVEGYSGLLFTDGTSSRTFSISIEAPFADNYYTNSVRILGVAGDDLYFTADIRSFEGGQESGLFYTDGVSSFWLAKFNHNVHLLGSNDQKAFFSFSDAQYGQELWAIDLSSHDFGLVVDIIPGSGSAFAEYPIGAFMAGDKLAFSAYTSASDIGFFLSDGTHDGTIQIGESTVVDSAVVGDRLYFADSEGLHFVGLNSEEAEVVTLVGDNFDNNSSHLIQSDSDQVFLRASGQMLYASQESDGELVELVSNVVDFKVFEEDAIYAIQEADGKASLWFSDGTAEGTWYVSQLEGDAYLYDLSSAVAIRTLGMHSSWETSSDGMD